MTLQVLASFQLVGQPQIIPRRARQPLHVPVVAPARALRAAGGGGRDVGGQVRAGRGTLGRQRVATAQEVRTAVEYISAVTDSQFSDLSGRVAAIAHESFEAALLVKSLGTEDREEALAHARACFAAHGTVLARPWPVDAAGGVS